MYIERFVWDDANVEHIALSRVTTRDVESVWLQDPKYRSNKRNRAATHQMIGPDTGGTFFAVFIREETTKGLWRVITARQAEDHEENWWRRS